MGTGFSKRKKEARALQQQFAQLQNKMAEAEVVGSAGNGLVTLTLTGNRELKQVKIKPECVDPEDIEGLEDLIKAAYGDALTKLQSEADGGMAGLPGNMPQLPGMEKFKDLF